MIQFCLENSLKKQIIKLTPKKIKIKLVYFLNSIMFYRDALLNYFFKLIKKYKKLTFFLAFDNSENFGDAFNIYLFDYYKIKYQIVNYNRANTLGVGSIIENYLASQKVKSKNFKNRFITFCGSGFIQPILVESYDFQNKFKVNNPIQVRGINSQKILTEVFNLDNRTFILGDPGLLMRKVFQEKFDNQKEKYDIGIIPHYVDKDLNWNRYINLKNYSYKVIDILSGVENVIEDVLSSRFVLSSSLHGLIAADSFSIPNCRLIVSDRITGGDFKFEDYYSVYPGRKKLILDLGRLKLNDSNIEIIAASFIPCWDMVSEIINDLDYFYSKQIHYNKNH